MIVTSPDEAAPTDVWLVRLSRTPAHGPTATPRMAGRPLMQRTPNPPALPHPDVAPAAPAAALPPTTAAPGPGKSAAGASVAGAAAPGAGVDARVLAAIRSALDCAHPQGHQGVEVRERCDRKLVQEARRAPQSVDPIPPGKRAYYDAVEKAYEIARYKTPVIGIAPQGSGAAGALAETPIGMPGRAAGVGCGLAFGGPAGKRKPESYVDHIKATGMVGAAIGPLNCGVELPQGPLTPEVGIPGP